MGVGGGVSHLSEGLQDGLHVGRGGVGGRLVRHAVLGLQGRGGGGV